MDDAAPGFRQLRFVDPTRRIKPGHGFAGAAERRLDVLLWSPTGGAGPRPLVIYCHGTGGTPDNAEYLDGAGLKNLRGFAEKCPETTMVREG